MLNLDETLKISNDYTIQKDNYLKFFLYSFSVIIFIDILRNQVSEVNLLQLVPGFYLILLFLCLIFLVVFSDFFFQLPILIDNKKEFGTKTLTKVQTNLILKNSFYFCLLLFFIGVILILPLSLDSFNSYGEKTLENIWSLDEVINLEFFLLILLIIFSQVPIFSLSYFTNENSLNLLPQFWKLISFLSFLFAGLLTPTVDGYTQLSFGFLSVFLYLIIIGFLQKRLVKKFTGLITLN